eukprot:361689-Chlamydomonas_euryale.AAC.2
MEGVGMKQRVGQGGGGGSKSGEADRTAVAGGWLGRLRAEILSSPTLTGRCWSRRTSSARRRGPPPPSASLSASRNAPRLSLSGRRANAASTRSAPRAAAPACCEIDAAVVGASSAIGPAPPPLYVPLPLAEAPPPSLAKAAPPPALLLPASFFVFFVLNSPSSSGSSSCPPGVRPASMRCAAGRCAARCEMQPAARQRMHGRETPRFDSLLSPVPLLLLLVLVPSHFQT